MGKNWKMGSFGSAPPDRPSMSHLPRRHGEDLIVTPLAQVSTHLFLPSCAKQAEPTSFPMLTTPLPAGPGQVCGQFEATLCPCPLARSWAAKYAGAGRGLAKRGGTQKTRWAKESWAGRKGWRWQPPGGRGSS